MLRSLVRTRPNTLVRDLRPISLQLSLQTRDLRTVPIPNPPVSTIGSQEFDPSSFSPDFPVTYNPPVYNPPISNRQLKIQELLKRDIVYHTLSNGQKIPALAYQAYYQNDWKPKPWKELFLKGYRHIDWGSCMSHHTYLPQPLWYLAHELTRSDLFVTAKLDSWWHHDPKESLFHTLRGLRTGYLDMWVMRYPVSWRSKNDRKPPVTKDGDEIDYIHAWKAMEEEVDAGRVKSLGISNFSRQELDKLLEHARYKPMIHQMEITPYLQQKEFVEYNKSLGITPAAYIPVGVHSQDQGLLCQGLYTDQTLVYLANKYRVEPRHIISAWHINSGIISIPHLDDAYQGLENLRAEHIKLDEKEMEMISNLDRKQRIFKPKLLGYFPFSDLEDPDLVLPENKLPTVEEVKEKRQKRIEFAKAAQEAHEVAVDGNEDRFGTTTYAGAVFGWVRSMEGSRKAADNKTGHFGPHAHRPKPKKGEEQRKVIGRSFFGDKE